MTSKFLTEILPIISAVVAAVAALVAKGFYISFQNWRVSQVNKCPYFKELHHVSLSVSNLDDSLIFYLDFLKLTQLVRPGVFGFPGAWFALPNGKQLHLVENGIDAEKKICHKYNEYNAEQRAILPEKFKEIFEIIDKKKVINHHFAIRAKTLKEYNQLRKEADRRHIVYSIGNFQGLEQMYIHDPDKNIIEIACFEGEVLKSKRFVSN